VLGHGVGAFVTERVQLLDQRLALDSFAFGNPAGELADSEWSQQQIGRASCRERV